MIIIRNQHRDRIINFTNVSDLFVSHDEQADKWEIMAFCPRLTDAAACLAVAAYSTEEKAVKALDMFCVFAGDKHIESICPERCGYIDGIVFDMPQDSELD